MIYRRLLFFDALKFLLFFTSAFTFLYFLIDYSIHARSFVHAQFSLSDLLNYYGCQFTKRAQLILTFALLLATVKSLLGLNMKGELTALYGGGISAQKIFQPLLLLGCFCTLFFYVNEEVLQPFAELHLKRLEENYFHSQSNDLSERFLHGLSLQYGSVIVYQYYDPKEQAFFDAFWIKGGGKEIVRCKWLYPRNIPEGKYVDLLRLNERKELTKKQSFEELLFPDLHLDEKEVEEMCISPAIEAPSTLFKKLTSSKFSSKELHSEILAEFLYKLLMPLITFLVVLLPAPYCLSFGRNKPVFMIYGLTIFGYIVLTALLDAALIISESNLLSPLLLLPLMLTPFFIWGMKNLRRTY